MANDVVRLHGILGARCYVGEMTHDESNRAAGLSPLVARKLDALIAWATHISAGRAMAVTALAIALTASIDFLSSSEMWFGPSFIVAKGGVFYLGKCAINN